MDRIEQIADYTFKYIITGNAFVGKSNISYRFSKNTFLDKQHTTISLDFIYKNIKIGKKIYQIQIWETAGQESFKSITRGYYKNSVCGIVFMI